MEYADLKSPHSIETLVKQTKFDFAWKALYEAYKILFNLHKNKMFHAEITEKSIVAHLDGVFFLDWHSWGLADRIKSRTLSNTYGRMHMGCASHRDKTFEQIAFEDILALARVMILVRAHECKVVHDIEGQLKLII